jgi:chromosome segregation ATPase
LKEQQKYAELEKQHSEAMCSHLQEVTTLRVSFDKAKVDIDNYRKSAEAELEAKEKQWKEERSKLEERCKLETQAKIIINETLLNKEREWSEERSTLEGQIEEYKGKCKTAQREIEEYREDAKSLREGFDKARIEIDKYRDVAERGLKIKEMEWNAKQLSLEEQIIQLSRSPQVEGQKKPEKMTNTEVPWAEEREHLEMEIRLLKETIATALGTNSSTTSIESTVKTECTYIGEVTASSGNDSTAKEHLRIQLTNAVKEAEDMRNFNSLIRKEHAITIDSLESELREERQSKTECMSQIVKLQYEVSVLEQDLADARAEVNRKMMQPTPRHRGHDSASYNSSCNDSQTYSQSYRSSEDSHKRELEVYKLKEALTEKIDEAKKYRRELETLKEEMDEADKRKLLWASSSAEYEEQIQDLKKKIHHMQQQMEDDLMKRPQVWDAEEQIRDLKKTIHHMQQQQMEDNSINKPLVWDAAVQVGQNDSNSSRERVLLERLDECNDRINQLQREYEQDIIEREDAFRTELRETKKKFGDSIREQEKMYLRKLRESKKDDENDVRDEAIYNKIRELQKDHERELVVKEDSFKAKLREQEDAFRVKLREQEERYLKEINEAKKKDDPYSSREIEKLMKQRDEINEKRIKAAIAEKEEEFNLRIKDILASKAREYEHTISDLEDSVRVLKQIIGTKDKEFNAKIKEYEDEIEQVKEELKDVRKDKQRVIEQHEIKVELLEDEIQELKQVELKASSKKDDRKSELSECKKELDRQRRKHRSEINQLNNTLEMQKSKQERLQSHIQSLEKQISDMVNDYESRLLNAMYGDVDGV